MAAPGDEALVGRVLDRRYRILERIARGGMASVFMAQDERLDRTVAVKVMHTGLGDDDHFTDRFVREARAAAKLNHPNVVAVFDQGSDEGITYLVMEHVAGRRTLRDVLREEAPMPPQRALGLLEQVLVALSQAHENKLIHRDVKPENVLMTPEGGVKVADFGLARAVSSATTATGGTLIGTVSYLAPEIVVNDGADARSDVYACGAMLYEMLTGLKPHAGETPIQVAYKHVHEDVGAPSAVQPGIPAYVDALVARATARDRDQRSTDARVLLQQVRQVRRALDDGVTEDPALVADLLPRPSARDASSEAATERVAALAGGGTLDAGGERTEVVDLPRTEPTVQWEPPTAGAAAAPPERGPGLHPAMGKDDYKTLKSTSRTTRRGRLLLLVALVVALLAALGGWYYGVGRYDDTPDLVGASLTSATAEAKQAGLKVEVVEQRFSESVPSETVMSSSPDAGARILPGSTVELVVSKGKERYKVPQLKGVTVAQAEARLEKVNLRLGATSTEYSQTIEKGRVIKAADYEVGTQLKRESRVSIVVSRGREPVDLANWVGRPASSARSAMREQGLEVKTNEQFSDDVPKGSVIAQSPGEGEVLKGDTVTLTVSKGQDLVRVPFVKDRPRTQATRLLERAGFKVRAIGPGNFKVAAQQPGANAMLKRGSTVTIVGI